MESSGESNSSNLRSYEEVEAELKALPKSILSAMSPVERNKTTPDHGFDVELIRFDFDMRNVSENDISCALETLKKMTAPVSYEIAAIAISTLMARTIAAKRSQEEMDVKIQVYIVDVMDYPSDIVVEACRSLGRHQKFFPSLSEIIEACEWRIKKRRLMLEALERCVA